MAKENIIKLFLKAISLGRGPKTAKGNKTAPEKDYKPATDGRTSRACDTGHGLKRVPTPYPRRKNNNEGCKLKRVPTPYPRLDGAKAMAVTGACKLKRVPTPYTKRDKEEEVAYGLRRVPTPYPGLF